MALIPNDAEGWALTGEGNTFVSASEPGTAFPFHDLHEPYLRFPDLLPPRWVYRSNVYFGDLRQGTLYTFDRYGVEVQVVNGSLRYLKGGTIKSETPIELHHWYNITVTEKGLKVGEIPPQEPKLGWKQRRKK